MPGTTTQLPTTIVLPRDNVLRTTLQAKLQEYKDRCDTFFKHLEETTDFDEYEDLVRAAFNDVAYRTNRYKHTILDLVLSVNEATTWKDCENQVLLKDEVFEDKEFFQAYAAIAQHCGCLRKK